MSRRVDIVMATYNGEPYIHEQLQSILWQDYENFRLLIHDDGSSDNTVEEIRKFEKEYPEKVKFIDDGISFRDPKRNFEHLLKMTDADFVFLSDQDDIWLPSKVSLMVNKLEELENRYGKNTPILVFSDYAILNKFGMIASKSISQASGVDPRKITLEFLLNRNIISGFSAAVNNAAVKAAIPIPAQAIMHDWWLALICAATGRVEFVPQVMSLYRLHESNTIGVPAETKKKRILDVISSPISSAKSFRRRGPLVIEQSKVLLNHLKDITVDENSISVVSDYIEYRTHFFRNALRNFHRFAADSWILEVIRIVLWSL